MSLDNRVILILSSSLLLIASVFFSMRQVYLGHEEIAILNMDKHNAYLLADELSQSSDDLSRMARSYVATGDIKYKQRYYDILAIRNGDKSKPANPEIVYWMNILDSEPSTSAPTTMKPLLHIIAEEGLTRTEFAKLSEAKNLSDKLSLTEEKSFALMEGLYPDQQGLYTVSGNVDTKQAINLIYGADYSRKKVEIMNRIEYFFEHLDQRISSHIESATMRSDMYFYIVLAILTSSVVIALLFFIYSHFKLVKPIEKLRQTLISASENNKIARYAQVDGVDEVANLSSLFNRVVDKNKITFDTMSDEINQINRDKKDLETLSQHLKSREKCLETSQRLSKIGSWQLDVDNKELHWSNETYQILEITMDKCTPDYETFIAKVDPNDRELVTRTYKETYKNKTPYCIQYRMLMDDGRVKYIEERGEIGCDKNSELIYWYGSIQDITTVKETLIKLKDYRDNLEKLVNKRTDELLQSNKKLAKTSIAAESANTAKSNFLASVGHEFRTPLNVIIGFTDILLDSPLLKSSLKSHLNKIHGSSHKLRKQIDDILLFCKLEGKTLSLADNAFNLTKEFKNLLLNSHQLCKEKGITFDINFEGDYSIGHQGDLLKINQVVVFLVSNAIKFTQRGGIVIRVISDSDGRLTVVVTDTGVGISDENIDKIFDDFYQVDSSASRQYEGVGLGLSICKELVEFMGGELQAESELGKGSAFTFSIPLKIVERRANVIPFDSKERRAQSLPSIDTPKLIPKAPQKRKKSVLDSHEAIAILEQIRVELQISHHPSELLDDLLVEQHNLDSSKIAALKDALDGFDLEEALNIVNDLLITSRTTEPQDSQITADGHRATIEDHLKNE